MAEQGEHGISWCDRTWNPVVGCTKVSQGCKHCYAKMIHDMRHKAYLEGKKIAPQYAHPFETVQLMPDRLRQPLSWRKPQRVFVNSVSDLFHEDIPDDYIVQVFMVMAEAERHTFQILTKRPERMLRWFTEYLPEACSGERPAPVWPLPNVWLGTSVENQKAADERIPHLLATPAAVRFLSCEPLLGPVSLRHIDIGDGCLRNALNPMNLHRLDWIIVGGESGKGARPMHPEWARALRDQCYAAGVAFHFKQWGVWQNGSSFSRNKVVLDDGRSFDSFDFSELKGADAADVAHHRPVMMGAVGPKRAGRLLDGELHDAFPGGAR